MAKKTQEKMKTQKPHTEPEVLEDAQEVVSENTIEEDPSSEETDSQEDGPSLSEEVETLKAELSKTQEALKAAEDYNLRLNADFINFRKRKEKEMAEIVKFANQDLMVQLLPILDNFDRTLEAIEKTDNLTAIKEGIASVSKSMQQTLGKVGLEPIEAKGQPFDSEYHEAVTTVPVGDESQKEMVVDEIEKGYMLKDKVIRFSKVIVGE